jgi:hypothetical protein
VQLQAEQADRFGLHRPDPSRRTAAGGIDHGDRAAAFDFQGVVRADEGRGVLVQADADGEGL